MLHRPLRWLAPLALALGMAGCHGHTAGLSLDPPAERPAREWLAAARAAERQGKLDRALVLARYAIAAAPADPATYTQAGAYLTAAGDLDRAEAAYRAALRHGPDYRPARLGLGWLRLRQQKPDQALSELSLNTHRFEETHLKGALLIAIGEASAGRTVLRQAKAMADRTPRAVPDAALADIDCRLAAREGDQATCPMGPVHIPPAPTDGGR